MKVDIFRDWSYKRIGLLVGIIVFAFAAIVINTQAHGWVAWYRLATDGRKTDATITAKQSSSTNRANSNTWSAQFRTAVSIRGAN
jgi:hypothetical protein